MKNRIIILAAFLILSFPAISQISSREIYNAKIDSLIAFENNPDATIEDKIKILNDCDIVYWTPIDKLPWLENIYLSVLKESKKRNNLSGCFLCYSKLGESHHLRGRKTEAKAYFDSAKLYISKVNDKMMLADYYYNKASLCYNTKDKMRANENFYSALLLYEQIPGCEKIVGFITSMLFTHSRELWDELYERIKNYPPRLYENREVKKSLLIYKIRRLEEKEDSFLNVNLDSIYSYYSEIQKISIGFDSLYYKAIMATVLLSYEFPDYALIEDILNELERSELEESLLYLYYDCKALYYLRKNRLDDAQSYWTRCEEIINRDSEAKEAYLNTSGNIHSIIGSCIFAKRGDIYKSLATSNLMLKVERKRGMAEVSDVKVYYELKEEKLKRANLESINKVLKGQNIMAISALVLLLLSIALFYANYRTYKKKTVLQQEEAKLKIKLKEEEAMRIETEKYEILSDNNLKVLALTRKEHEVKELMDEKAELDAKFEEYRLKFEEYEAAACNDAETKENAGMQRKCELLKRELEELLIKKMPGKTQYIKYLEQIKPNAAEVLQNSYSGKMSGLYVKYCFCFAIGMNIKDVADLFSIEDASVRVLRSRIKSHISDIGDSDVDTYLHNTIIS